MTVPDELAVPVLALESATVELVLASASGARQAWPDSDVLKVRLPCWQLSVPVKVPLLVPCGVVPMIRKPFERVSLI